MTHELTLPPSIPLLTTTSRDVRLRSPELKAMENVVTSQLLIYSTLVYPWQARRSPGPSSWGKSILALILGVSDHDHIQIWNAFLTQPWRLRAAH